MISRRKLICNAGLLLAASGGHYLHPDILLAEPGSALGHPPESKLDRYAPTASMDAIAIDRIWQQASRRYNKPRAEILAGIDRQANDGPFRPDWQSLAAYRAPDWYKDAKFGIFVHWGLYSVPAFGSEQYPRLMYTKGTTEYEHQISTYGPLTQFGYKDFIPMFKAEHYDPVAWARLFQRAGARYVVPVFEHHDGFAMYDSDLSRWTATKMGPRRDLAGELIDAARKIGLHVGASSHRIEHDWFLHPGRKINSDVNDPRLADFYGPAQRHFVIDENSDNFLEDWTYVSTEFVDDWLARAAEVVNKYRPELFYFDFWIGKPEVRADLARFAAFFYNRTSQTGPTGVINYKLDDMQPQSAVVDVERGVFADIQSECWQTDTSISNKSWGYIENDIFKTPEFIVHEMVDVVSKNGNLLLNVGPRANGAIPEKVQQILLDVGAWLGVNGEAIYGTRPWKRYGEGPTKAVAGPVQDTRTPPYTAQDFRFTAKGNAIYAVEMGWPSGGQAVIHLMGKNTLGANVQSVALLGRNTKLQFDQRSDCLRIQLPEQKSGKYAYVFRIVI